MRSISLGGMSVRETALKLSMTETAVRVTLHRALKKLAALYRADTVRETGREGRASDEVEAKE